jgi:2-methylfumaryl-CoA hydratase
VFAWSEVLDKIELPRRSDVGALRLRTVATKDQPCTDLPYKQDAADHSAVILDLDYWALMPR